MKPKIEWVKFEPEVPEKHLNINGFSLGVSFEKTESLGVGAKDIKAKTLELLQVGYGYTLPIINGVVSLSGNIVVEFGTGASHARNGTLMIVSIPQIQEILSNPDNQRSTLLQESLFVHELLHNISEQENFSMFLEMIFMIEKGQDWRIDDIRKLYVDKKIGVACEKGLEDIALWLGYGDVVSMLSALSSLDIERLKKIFKQELRKYWEEERKHFKKEPGT